MSAKRLKMKTIRKLLELRIQAQVSQRQVSKVLGCDRKVIRRYERLATMSGLTDFNLVQELSDEELFTRLGLQSNCSLLRKSYCFPDYLYIHTELTKPHVTLALLWEEYFSDHPMGYKYSQFCEHYRRWKKSLSVTMRQEHRAGEKVFVDYAGTPVKIIVNPKTGEIREAQLFVGVLGASSYTFCELSWSQCLPDWLMSHRRMFEYFGGVPEIIIPDNLKSGITKPDRYEATVNRSYEELATHYGSCVIPARIVKPKDKAKVEAGVLFASRWILASLRNKEFYSLSEANEAVGILLEKLNNKTMRQLKKSRRELFESIDQPTLRRLNPSAYVFSQWKKARVNIDYHIAFDGCFYSTPYQLVGKEVEVRATQSVIEVFHGSHRVASHCRSDRPGHCSTNFSHRPKSHQEYVKWTPERITHSASQKGPQVGLFVKSLVSSKPHPEQGYRAALGVIRLSDKYGETRLNQACAKALNIQSISYQTVKNILRNNMDKADHPKANEITKEFFSSNSNVRGKEYYQ